LRRQLDAFLLGGVGCHGLVGSGPKPSKWW
jgi:hypothetical protein